MGDLIRQRLGAVVVGIVVLLFLSANRIATFLTDLWWFDAIGFGEVFTGLLVAKIVLFAVFGVSLGVLVGVNLHLARRFRPFVIPASPQQAIVERYRQMADPFLPWLIVGVAVLFGLTAGGAAVVNWQEFLLWRNAETFGTVDPQFGRDIGFYMFQLPWLKFVQSWLFTSLVLTMLVTAGAHYLLGGIRPEVRNERLTPKVKTHLSVLLVFVLGARAWGFWLDRFLLNYSPRGQVTGAAYTDVNAELPALNLLLGVAAVSILLVIVSIRRRGFVLPGAAIAILLIAGFVLSGIYPAIVQRFRVDPQELSREAEYIDRNLKATRDAFGLSATEEQSFTVSDDLSQEQIDANQTTLTNVRLWDPAILETTYAQLQSLRTYYDFRDVDVDRYEIDGEIREVMLSTRELSLADLPETARTWQNERLRFTHGYGIVSSQVNSADASGQPVFLSKDIPPRGTDVLVPDVQAGIYFGERDNPTYSIVNSGQAELDYESSSGQVETSYEGDGGVPTSSYARRLAFALRFGDTNFVLSNLIEPDSRVMFRRDVRERVEAVAPYLSFDADPYPVVLEGRIYWIQDTYTTSNWYPYSERIETTRAGQINYIRNSIKAVVDAYDGSVQLVVVDETDPVMRTWRKAFPEGYVTLAEAPDGIEAHLRYPEDLFTIQAAQYRTYHIPDALGFYDKSDAWDFPSDPAAIANGAANNPVLRPYYLLMTLPGETEAEFVLIQPYLARGKDVMSAWLAGRSDPGHYGELLSVQFPSDQTVLGPTQALARIEQESEISSYITLRDQQGSSVIRGNMIVLPIADSILYVLPLFLQNEQSKIPELSQVAVVMGNDAAMEPNLADAIAELLAKRDGGGGPATEADPDATADELFLRALQAFLDADAALAEGNLGEYQRQVTLARTLSERAARLRGLETPQEEPPPAATPGDGEAPADGEAPTSEPTSQP